MNTLRDTFHLIAEDCRRLHGFAGGRGAVSRWRLCSLALRPEVLPVVLYRFAHFWHVHRCYFLARLLYRINLLVTGCDIHPASRIGGGCLLVHSVGTVVAGSLGRNATLFALVVIDSGCLRGDLSEAPLIGDNVTLSTAATVIGAVRIANGVTVGPYTVVQHSIEEEGSLFAQVVDKHTQPVLRKKSS